MHWGHWNLAATAVVIWIPLAVIAMVAMSLVKEPAVKAEALCEQQRARVAIAKTRLKSSWKWVRGLPFYKERKLFKRLAEAQDRRNIMDGRYPFEPPKPPGRP